MQERNGRAEKIAGRASVLTEFTKSLLPLNN